MKLQRLSQRIIAMGFLLLAVLACNTQFAQADSLNQSISNSSNATSTDPDALADASTGGTIQISGTLSAQKISFLNFGKPSSLGVVVGNDGAARFQTTVNLDVKNIFGKTVFSKTTNEYIAPQTQQKIGETWSPHAPIGLYHVERSASLPNVGTKQLVNRLVFVVQPWVLIGLVGLILVIIAGIIVLHRRKARYLPRL